MFLPLAISHTTKVAIIAIVIIIAVLLILWLALGFVFFLIALGSKKREDETVPSENSLFERNADNEYLQSAYKWYDTTYKQEVSVPARDKKRNLHAVEFRNPSNSNTWVVVIHGWTNVKREVSTYTMQHFNRGFNVLIPDLRGHGNSESKYVSMGWLDRLEIVDWINNIVEENPNAKIVIHGVSMGGATTMMTTGEKLPANVVCAIEDCGFTGVYDIFEDQCIRKYHVPPKIVMPAAGLVNKIMNGFSLRKASAVEQLKKSVTPTLFIHGDKDDFVLYKNLDKVFNACAAKKKKYTMEGAEHAVSVFWYPEKYIEVCNEWLSENGLM